MGDDSATESETESDREAMYELSRGKLPHKFAVAHAPLLDPVSSHFFFVDLSTSERIATDTAEIEIAEVKSSFRLQEGILCRNLSFEARSQEETDTYESSFYRLAARYKNYFYTFCDSL